VNADEGTSGRQRLTRAEAKARTREQLLDAAARIFARKGYAGASVEEIAESAGYSTGALYSNFAGKQELFLELMSRKAERYRAAVAGILEPDAGGDPVAALAELLERAGNPDPDLMALRAEFWLYAVRNPDAMGALIAQRREQVDALVTAVSAAMERLGAPAGASASTVATLALAMFQGLMRQRRIDPDRVSGELLAQGLRWLFAGLQASAAESSAG
jgi:AcrR family transcriptional regulator